ncbi:MAG: S-layer homology domain-containing protein, partial [Clostridia bacterium]|nr:S-layer homology domain-containing protein [Clostridia bacterium]
MGGSYEVSNNEAAGATTPQWVEEERYLRERKVFNDLESVSWAEDSIRELYNLGIISGRSEGVFAPNDYVTREEAAKMLILMAGIDTTAL